MPDLFGKPTPDENIREQETNFLLEQFRKAAAPALQRAQNFIPAMGGGFYLKGFKPGAPFEGFPLLVNKAKKLFFRDQLETGIVAGKNMAQGNFGSVKGAEKIASQFVKQLRKRKVPKPESRKN